MDQALIVRGDLVIDRDRRRVHVGNRIVTLRAREFDLLVVLASHPGRVFTRQVLLDRVWGRDHAGYERTINVHINRLRSALEEVPARPRYVLTERGVGYRFADPADLVSATTVGERSRASHSGQVLERIGVRRETRLVGRQHELAELRHAVATVADGRGGFVLLEGEGGVGKTRLLDGLVRELVCDQTDVTVLYGAAPPGERAGRGAIAQAVIEHFGVSALETQLNRLLTRAAALVPSFAHHLRGEAVPPGLARLTSESIHVLYAELLDALAAEGPVLWLVDDLHYASREERSVVCTLAARCHRQRVALVATTRPGLPAEEVAHFVRLDGSRHLVVDRLDPQAIDELLFEALAARRFERHEAVASELVQRSDRNPYFLLALVDDLGSRGVSDRPRAPTVERIPDPIRSFLAARLDGLDESERELLDAAAILGYRFDGDLVARALRREPVEVMQVLASLARRTRLVEPAGQEFRFDHHLLFELLLGRIAPALGRVLHGELARAFAEREGLSGIASEAVVASEHALFLAHHLLRSGATAADARPWVVAAIDHLAALFRWDELLDLSELAIQGPGRVDVELACALRLRQASGFERQAQHDRQRAAAEDALRLSTDLSEQWRLQAQQATGRAYHRAGDYERARTIYRDVAERARRAGLDSVERDARCTLGAVSFHLGRVADAWRQYDRELQIARSSGDVSALLHATVHVGFQAEFSARHDAARTHAAKGLKAAREAGERRAEEAFISLLGWVTLVAGDPSQAGELLREAERHSRHLGDVKRANTALRGQSEAYLRRGDVAAARASLEQIAHGSGWREEPFDDGLTTILRCRIELVEGNIAPSRAPLEQLRTRADQLHNTLLQLLVRLVLGDVARELDALDDSIHCFEEALELAKRLRAPARIAEASLGLGRGLLAAGQTDAATIHLERADELVRRHRPTSPGAVPAALLASIGHRDAAAINVDELTPMHERAECHLLLDRCHAPGEHLERAVELVDHLCRHLTVADRERFWRHSPAARALRAAQLRRRQRS